MTSSTQLLADRTSAPQRPLGSGGFAHEHRLWWRLGQHGKGILFDCGLVHTWPEGEGDHQHHIDRHYRRTGARPRMIFHVRPTGEVRIPEQHAADAAKLTALLAAADSRLRPFAPPAATEPERAVRPSARDCERWAMPQRRGRSRAL